MKTKHAFIAAHASEHAIRFMCRVLWVAHSWFHARRRAAPKRAERVARRGRLGSEIREIFEQSKRCYGAPRIHAELKARGFRTSKRTVAKLMRENGIRPPRGRRRAPITTDSRHSDANAPNLLDRNFEAVAPDAVWLADISYITTDEGWLYLATVKDLATMEIVGWSMSERLKSVLCEEALKMAIRSRRLPMGLIHHSDRRLRTVIATSYARVLRRPVEPAQYACGDYRKLLRLHGIKASMSRKGNCLDNAPMESFFGSLKTELVHRTRFSTRREARAALFEYIEIFYNQRRRHSSIGYRTPAQARRDMTIASVMGRSPSSTFFPRAITATRSFVREASAPAASCILSGVVQELPGPSRLRLRVGRLQHPPGLEKEPRSGCVRRQALASVRGQRNGCQLHAWRCQSKSA